MTTNGDLWTNNVIVANDIIYMSAYKSSVIALKEDGYYAMGDRYYLDTFKKIINNYHRLIFNIRQITENDLIEDSIKHIISFI